MGQGSSFELIIRKTWPKTYQKVEKRFKSILCIGAAWLPHHEGSARLNKLNDCFATLYALVVSEGLSAFNEVHVWFSDVVRGIRETHKLSS